MRLIVELLFTIKPPLSPTSTIQPKNKKFNSINLIFTIPKQSLPKLKTKKTNLKNLHLIKLDIKDIYNRLLCFSSDQYHSANNFSNKNSSRLTLIGFIHKINNSNLPILRSKQTLMM